jgi:predicted DNA-binding transcriptional regulator AlpA
MAEIEGVTPRLITTADLAEYLSMSAQTVKEWRSKGKGPRWVKVEGSVRYRWSDVESWLTSIPRGEA